MMKITYHYTKPNQTKPNQTISGLYFNYRLKMRCDRGGGTTGTAWQIRRRILGKRRKTVLRRSFDVKKILRRK